MLEDAHVVAWKKWKKREYTKKWQAANPDKMKAAGKRWRMKNPENIKRNNINYRLANPEKIKADLAKWRAENIERTRQTSLKWAANNLKRRLATEQARRARKITATPNWEGIRKECAEIYKNCPEGYHVDHDVPLRGKLVCGLHVPWNLKYLPAKENIKKKNHFNPETYDWWPEGHPRPTQQAA
jgi:hypothetical protein